MVPLCCVTALRHCTCQCCQWPCACVHTICACRTHVHAGMHAVACGSQGRAATRAATHITATQAGRQHSPRPSLRRPASSKNSRDSMSLISVFSRARMRNGRRLHQQERCPRWMAVPMHVAAAASPRCSWPHRLPCVFMRSRGIWVAAAAADRVVGRSHAYRRSRRPTAAWHACSHAARRAGVVHAWCMCSMVHVRGTCRGRRLPVLCCVTW